jgi:hypothetical protein
LQSKICVCSFYIFEALLLNNLTSLDFWKEVEEFFVEHGDSPRSVNALRRLNMIVETYLLETSIYPVNIPSILRKKVESIVEDLKAVNPKMFEQPNGRASRSGPPSLVASPRSSSRHSEIKEDSKSARQSTPNSNQQSGMVAELMQAIHACEDEIVKLMYFDSFTRFKSGEDYKRVMNSLAKGRIVRESVVSSSVMTRGIPAISKRDSIQL